MKIVATDKTVVVLNKGATEVGELYKVNGSDGVHLRCQGGFVHMQSGKFTDYESCRTDSCWIHLPAAELHLNN